MVYTYGKHESAALAQSAVLVGSLEGAGAGDGVLAAGADARDAAGDDEHPEHAGGVGAVGGGGQHDAEDEQDGGGDGARLAAELVDDDAEEQHADDHADEERVAQPLVDGRRQGLGVEDGQEQLHVADDGGVAGDELSA